LKNWQTVAYLKGLHSGRPLRKPIQNCVAVYTDNELLFDLVYLLYKGRKFESDIIGSVVPFIRIDDLRKVISAGLQKYSSDKEKYLTQNAAIDQLISMYQEKIKTLQSLQMAFCHEFLK